MNRLSVDKRFCNARFLLLGAGLTILSTQMGCATVTRGSTDEVVFESDPPGARVTLDPPTVECTTPCRQELRRKRSYLVTFEKEGYLMSQATIEPKFAGAGAAGFAGNILLGGLVGMGVDTATGASKVLRPNPLRVTLEPNPTPVAASAATPSTVAAPMTWSPPQPPAPPPASAHPQCIQPGLVDREICHGRLRIGMAKAEAVALLGTPEGTSRDQLTYRYGDRYLKFDANESLLAISDKP